MDVVVAKPTGEPAGVQLRERHDVQSSLTAGGGCPVCQGTQSTL